MTLVPQFLSFVYQYYVLEVPCAVDMNITDDVTSNMDIFYGGQVSTVWSRNASLEMDPCEDMIHPQGEGLMVGRVTYHCPHIRGSWGDTLAGVECGDMDTLLWWLVQVYQHYCNGMQSQHHQFMCGVGYSFKWLYQQ